MLIEHLKAKPAPFMYLDTHAGRGRYDLSHAQPQRSGEYLGGIGRLLKAPAASLPAEVAAYVDLVRRSAGPERSPITAYPGSPLIVELLRRPTDRLGARRESSGRSRRAARVDRPGAPRHRAGAGRVCSAQGPAPTRRAARARADRPAVRGRSRVRCGNPGPDFRTRTVAHRHVLHLVPAEQSAPGSLRFHRELRESGIRRILDAQLSVLPPDSAVGMQGCGLAIVNPPWQLDLALAQLLPQLHALLAPDGAGGTRVEWLVPE